MRKTAIFALLCTAVTVSAQQSVKLDILLEEGLLPAGGQYVKIAEA